MIFVNSLIFTLKHITLPHYLYLHVYSITELQVNVDTLQKLHLHHGRGSGATVPRKRSQSTKFQNFHFFARPLCQIALRQRFRIDLVLHPTAPSSERPYPFEGGPLNFGPRPPGRPTPKKVFPKFFKILRCWASFSSALNGDPQAPSGIKFWHLYLGPFLQKKIPKFRRKSTFYRVTRIFDRPKKLRLCAPRPP